MRDGHCAMYKKKDKKKNKVKRKEKKMRKRRRDSERGDERRRREKLYLFSTIYGDWVVV